MGGPSRQGCVVQKPVDNLPLRAEDGEALLARVHLRHLPSADAAKVAWVIRLYFYVVFARQEANLSATRRRALLWGTRPEPLPEASSASRQADGAGTRTAAVLEAEAAGVAATAHQAPPGAPQTPEQAKSKGGPRPGTGRLGAAAYVGATRVECRPAALAVGQRGPVWGPGAR